MDRLEIQQKSELLSMKYSKELNSDFSITEDEFN